MSVLSRFLNVFRQGSLDREFEEELRFHLDQRIERLVNEGMSREEAKESAYRQFGSVAYAKQGMQEARVMKRHIALAVVAGVWVVMSVGGFLWFQRSVPSQTGFDARVTNAGAPTGFQAQEVTSADPSKQARVTPPSLVQSHGSPDTSRATSAKVPTAGVARRVAFIESSPADVQAPVSIDEVTKRVEVDGFALRVYTGGLANRAPHQPVVIFVPGASGRLDYEWNKVLPAVAAFAPVIAYDRPDYGLPAGAAAWVSPTPEHVVPRVRELLGRMNLSPPYVFVGHTVGAVSLRYFAGSSPEEIAGLVYVEPIDLTLSADDDLALFASVGKGSDEREAVYEENRRSVKDDPPAVGAELAEVYDLMHDNRRLPPAPNVPTTVIRASRLRDVSQDIAVVPPYLWKARRQHRLQTLPTWVRAPGEFLIATNSYDGAVPLTEPDLVVEAIRRLVHAP